MFVKLSDDFYDFILGYDQYLISEGWIASWTSIANSFVTWAPVSSTDTIYLIPNNQVIQIDEGTRGYYDNINTKYDGVFNLINKEGKEYKQFSVFSFSEPSLVWYLRNYCEFNDKEFDQDSSIAQESCIIILSKEWEINNSFYQGNIFF